MPLTSTYHICKSSVRFGSAELFCRTVRFGPNSKVQKFGSVRFGRTQNSRVEVRFGSVRHKKSRFGSPLVSAIEIDTDEQWERISISMLFFGTVLTINISVLIAFLEVSYNTIFITKKVEYTEAKIKIIL